MNFKSYYKVPGAQTFAGALCAALLFAGAPRLNAQTWVAYSKPEVGMAFSMPCEPQWKATKTDSAFGPYTSNLGMCKVADETYLVAWVDYLPTFKPDIDTELKLNQDNFVKSVQAVLLTSTPATLDGLRGLDFTAQRQGKYLLTSRVVMDGYRPLMLVIATPITQNRSPNIRKFVDAFHVRRTSR
jgi:hypothetical protein